MPVAKVRIELRLDLWGNQSITGTSLVSPRVRNLELYLMHHVRSIFGLLEKEKSGVAEKGWCP
jgi:hypothetical protein